MYVQQRPELNRKIDPDKMLLLKGTQTRRIKLQIVIIIVF